MNKKKYIKECYRILAKHDLTPEQLARLGEQIESVVNECDSLNTIEALGTPEQFVNELFEINEISKIPRHRSSFSNRVFSVLFGLILIAGAVIYLLTPIDIGDLAQIIIYSGIAIWGLSLLFKRQFFIGLILIVVGAGLLLNQFNYLYYYNFSIVTVGIAFLLVALGLQFIFGKKYPHQSYRYHQSYHHGQSYQNMQNYEHTHTHHIDTEQGKSNEVISEQKMIIENRLNNTISRLTNEPINRIEITNSLGDVKVDLQDFTFSQGDLTIHLDNTLGNVQIKTNENTRVINNSGVTAGNITDKRHINKEYTTKITINGMTKFGNTEII